MSIWVPATVRLNEAPDYGPYAAEIHLPHSRTHVWERVRLPLAAARRFVDDHARVNAATEPAYVITYTWDGPDLLAATGAESSFDGPRTERVSPDEDGCYELSECLCWELTDQPAA
ncbi:hypothetical protein [Streptomyces sampsonii]|uniref:hypothetical protein n=1 Tax=Streptomyces sampsonii TaxID=42239 RepID=UPI0008F4D500|nr:hypothetical protein [Streptomyces sampsonii]